MNQDRRNGKLVAPILWLGITIVSLRSSYAKPITIERQHVEQVSSHIDTLEYHSRITGRTFRVSVYLPPGFDRQRRYPVLYLLHGIHGNERSWMDDCHADRILDGLCAGHRIEPMIVVMPASVALFDPGGYSWGRRSLVMAAMPFDEVLVRELIPLIESRYPVAADPLHRAIAGNSAGGGQALILGLEASKLFAWVASFSAAPNANGVASSITRDVASQRLRLIWLSCGDRDSLLSVSTNIRDVLRIKRIPFTWQLDSGGHDEAVWSADLTALLPLLFRN